MASRECGVLRLGITTHVGSQCESLKTWSIGIEGADLFSIAPDRRRVDFTYVTGEWTDDVRIITAVPEPGSVALLGIGVLAATLRRRKPS